MSGRDHPFNRSTRPLLERTNNHHAQPQLLSTKKKIGIPTATHAPPPPRLRGFNDFTFVPKIHTPPEMHNYYSGYPYGSPPSPTSAIMGHNDFVFSDDSGIHSNDLSHSVSHDTTTTSGHPTFDHDYADVVGDTGYHYQSMGGSQNADYLHWGPAAPSVAVDSAKGPFIFGVDTTTTATAVDRFRAANNGRQAPQHFNNNSVIHSNGQVAEQQVKKKAVSVPTCIFGRIKSITVWSKHYLNTFQQT